MKKNELPTPCYIINEAALRRNLEILYSVKKDTGCRILLAQKAFSCFEEYPVIGSYLDGTASSGLYEAKLGHEEMGLENHIFSPAYRPEEMDIITDICDHVVFNSFSQLEKYGQMCRSKGVSVGLRINPECSTSGGHALYDPCAPGSRLGVTFKAWIEGLKRLTGSSSPENAAFLVDGLHFHTLCEQDSDALKTTLDAVEEKFGPYMKYMKWINMGGGHHITRPGYNIGRLEECIIRVQERYGVTVYLEPGEAVALNAGELVTQVLDIVENGIKTLILDTSAECHMPDVLEMPYRPPLKNSGLPDEKAFTYRLSSCTCLAGDVIGDYSFDNEIKTGDKLYFQDMAIYSMVKNNTFNGMRLPAIAAEDEHGECRILKTFGYEDFKGRLG